MRSLSAYRRSLLPAIGAVTLLAIPVPSRADTANPLAELVDAAAGRLQVADDVAAVKWRTGGAVEDPVRVQQQLAKLADDAARNDLDPAYVQRIFGDQIDATEAVAIGDLVYTHANASPAGVALFCGKVVHAEIGPSDEHWHIEVQPAHSSAELPERLDILSGDVPDLTSPPGS